MTATNEQVNDARELLRRFLRPTRLVQAERLGRDSDTRIHLKLEIDLPTGSFKPRGAIYALMKNVERRSGNGERPLRGGRGKHMLKFIIVSLTLSLVILSVPQFTQAGDCFTHPVVIHELVINSCEILSEKNAASISQVAPPATIASRYQGAIIHGQERRRRKIEIDHPSLSNPTPRMWEKIKKPIKLLFVSDDPNVCSRFPNEKKTAVVYYTNCECDTGPHADGYCALTVLEVHEIPKKFEKYAR